MSPDRSDDPDGVTYGEFENPQSLNLYSYVRNNPLSNTDPDGHGCVASSSTPAFSLFWMRRTTRRSAIDAGGTGPATRFLSTSTAALWTSFHARCVPACQGQRPRRTPLELAKALLGMLPSAPCQSVGVLKFGVFRGSISWPVIPPVNASDMALRPRLYDSEPMRLAGPSPYGSCIRYILPARCGLHHVPPIWLLLR